MFDADQLSAEDVLRARTPAELFGEAAGDARALRRAWAKLLRRFPADAFPEAFGHGRLLFERAREALELGVEAVEAEGAEAEGAAEARGDGAGEPVVRAPSVAEQVWAARQAGEWQGLMNLLALHSGQLARTDSALLHSLIWALVANVGFQLTPSAVRTLMLYASSYVLEGDPDEQDRLVLALTDLEVLKEELADPALDGAVKAAVVHLWMADPGWSLAGLRALREALGAEGVLAAMASLPVRAPACFSVIWRAELRVDGVLPLPAMGEYGALGAERERLIELLPSEPLRGEQLWQAASVVGRSAFYAFVGLLVGELATPAADQDTVQTLAFGCVILTGLLGATLYVDHRRAAPDEGAGWLRAARERLLAAAWLPPPWWLRMVPVLLLALSCWWARVGIAAAVVAELSIAAAYFGPAVLAVVRKWNAVMDSAEVVALLRSWARERGLSPFELAVLLVGPNLLRLAAREVAFARSHPLVRLESDPGAFTACLDAKLIARVEAALSAAEERADG